MIVRRHDLIGFCLLAVVGGAAASACSGASGLSASRPAPDAVRVSVSDVSAAIDRSALYLAGLCDERGQFTYRTHLDPTVELEPAYNEVRHAGAVYALAQYCRRSTQPAVEAAMRRSARFLQREFVRPVAGNPRLCAVWMLPAPADEAQPPHAKLGGAGLALAALVSVEQVAPGTTPLEQLQALGRFIIFMQKPDGTFYSKYFPDTGRSDLRPSDYYPGEAVLGLLMLYTLDPAPQWLQTAAKGLSGITQRGAARRPTFPDHWFLLATARMMPFEPDHTLPMSRDAVLNHARQICSDMLSEQRAQRDSQIAGCFTDDGRSCPSATRLEGLLAALRFLPDRPPLPHSEIRASIDEGMRFLLRCQLTDGPQAGGCPRVLPEYRQPEHLSDKERALEIRVDYVQHALCAMLQFEAEFSSDTQ